MTQYFLNEKLYLVVSFNESTSVDPLNILNNEGLEAFMAYLIQWDCGDSENPENLVGGRWLYDLPSTKHHLTEAYLAMWSTEPEGEYVRLYKRTHEPYRE